jgi:hypothetical protein
MKAHIKAFCDNINAEYVGELLRPHGPILEAMLKNDIPVNDVLEAARQAGNQLIRYGKMFDETINNISRPLISRDDYLEMGNQHITSG